MFLLLIGFPILIALVLLLVRAERARGLIVIISSCLIAAGSLGLVFMRGPVFTLVFDIPPHYISWCVFALEIALAGFIFSLGIRNKRHFVSLLAVLQAALALYTELRPGGSVPVENAFAADDFSLIMGVIVGVVGGLIAVYSIAYMGSYHRHHPELRDRRPLFFFIQFIFLSAYLRADTQYHKPSCPASIKGLLNRPASIQ